ncbi:hypothetical protein [Agaribacter flavus]|uniref:Uncharacterized protein n=1 Tax=Agaribacter flavus TaxID=1902781 RepID=A0ABV7FPS1_9ALTE
MMFVLLFTKAKADTKTQIAVNVEIGASYTSVLGEVASMEAKTLAESELVIVLKDLIRYFDFVTSKENTSYTLEFKIDTPSSSNQGGIHSLHDYYVFLRLKHAQNQRGQTIHWLFRDAAASLHNADSPQTITASLSTHVEQVQHKRIVQELLKHVSFTDQARFNGSKGWIISHSAKALCMNKKSLVEIHSIVPGQGFEDEFYAEVKRHRDDHITTFILAKDDVSSLSTQPDQAKVLGVHVLKYERQCEHQNTLSETSPSNVSFELGGVE